VFFILSKILDVALSPLSWAIAFVALSFVPKLRPHARKLLGAAVATLVFFALPPVGDTLWGRLERGAKKTMRDGVTYDFVVVLGGMFQSDPSEESGLRSYNDNVERILVAYDVLRTGRARRVLLSGGDGMPGGGAARGEAYDLEKQLLDWGIAQDRIFVEPDSRNTHENAAFSAKVLAREHASSVLLITSAFHMPRAAGCFRKEGVVFDTLPVDYRGGRIVWYSVLPRTFALEESTEAIHEAAGRLIYRARGYSAPAD
jgi:uncharacterized SAM-binding protein YcdF (DUF218 family)